MIDGWYNNLECAIRVKLFRHVTRFWFRPPAITRFGKREACASLVPPYSALTTHPCPVLTSSERRTDGWLRDTRSMKTLCWRISASRSYSYPWPRPFDVIRFARISKQWARWTLQPFPKVVVPAFAVHWGVVVGPTIYHLVFEDENDADLECNDPCRDGKPIRFTFTKWKRRTEFLEALPVVGLTKFEHIQLCEIGETLVEEFGNYHRLFWNCQVFAKCFLRLITGGHDFDK